MFTSSPRSTAPPASPRAWRILGALILADTALTFAGAGLDHGAPALGAGQQEVVAQLVTMSLTSKVVGGYLEFLGLLAFLGWALLLARLLRGRSELAGWLSSAIAATAVLEGALTTMALTVGLAAAYDGHHGGAWQTLALINDGTDATYYGALGVRGAFVLCVAVAGLASRELPVWLSGLGVVVGLAGLVSPLGVGKDMQQYAFLLETVWMIALAVTALLHRRSSVVTHPVDVVAA